MKTRDLIEALQQIDPDGCTECCVGNADIFDVSRQPAYYDGRLETLWRDMNRSGYNVSSATMTAFGTKIVIKPLSIETAIMNDPDLEVDTQGDTHASDSVERWRRESVRARLMSLDDIRSER